MVWKERLVEDAERNSHDVAKCGKQSKKHFSTRNGVPESSYHPSDLRGERQALRGLTDICMRPARSMEEVLPSGILVLTMQESVIYKLSIMVFS